ncbi:hypothetical protein SMITH_453 [Smithella sp. ME-1]|uniref:Uncharacterized protein n=1 Tax=hydrocarbon metagenome TaxID=938273 RepID=A0A0W8FLV3_9ZZZZ|nr:hypothetical protein SMITH_453 [Smithella sp. ME-1]
MTATKKNNINENIFLFILFPLEKYVFNYLKIACLYNFL